MVHQNRKRTNIGRLQALNQVGIALTRERDEERLLQLIARTACELTGAAFAAFALRPFDAEEHPQNLTEEPLFQLAASVGITSEQEVLFRHIPLSGEGLLAPVFCQGVPILVADTLAHFSAAPKQECPLQNEAKMAAREAAPAFAQGGLGSKDLLSLGAPRGFPLMRSFLGAPLLAYDGKVQGGLLLGHMEPGNFREEDMATVQNLANQATLALENARLVRLAQRQAAELQAMSDHIADGVTLVNRQGQILRENTAAYKIRQNIIESSETQPLLEEMLTDPARAVLAGQDAQEQVVQVCDTRGEQREYLISAYPLHSPRKPSIPLPSVPFEQASDEEMEIYEAVVVWREVTDQREARKQATQLEAIFDTLPDALIITDASGRTVKINAATRSMFGLQDRPKAFLDPLQALRETLHVRRETGQSLAEDETIIARILRGESILPSHPSITLIRTPDGQTRYVSSTGAPLRDEEGQIAGAVTLTSDITEQKQAQQQLQEQTRQMQLQASLIDLAHDAILVRDPQNVILCWNQGAEALYGWSAREASGQISHSLLQTRFPGSKEEVDRRLEQDGRWEGELIHTCRSGQTVTVESRQVLMRDATGAPGAILEINRDNTERNLLEHLEHKARAEAERRSTLLQMILDALPSCIYLVRGQEARLVLANRAAASIFGAHWRVNQPLEDFFASHSILLQRPDGRLLEQEESSPLRVLKHGETVRQLQHLLRRSDETALPILVNAIPLDARQLPGGIRQAEPEWAALVMYQDVTALKEAEALKDEFLSLAAHELRSPLTVLKIHADMLLRHATSGEEALTPQQLNDLQRIAQAVTRLTDLTRDLLEVTRLQAELPTLMNESVDLIALIERVIEQQQDITQRHQLTLQTIQPPLLVLADEGRLEQVLTNLLSNAIKYSPQGGAIETSIHVENAGEVVLSIRDHGIGIPTKQHARIFGRFVRADNASAAEIPGTGLGLYLCRKLVERYHGRIWFESTEGVGSTFFVAFPILTQT